MRKILILLSLLVFVGVHETSARAPNPKLQIRPGILKTQVVAMGGETTGTVLLTSSGRVDLILNAELALKLEGFSGSVIGVVGFDKFLHGPELGDRAAIDVRRVVLWNGREVLKGKLLPGWTNDVQAKSKFSIQVEGEVFNLVLSNELQKLAQSAVLLERDIVLSGIQSKKRNTKEVFFYVDKMEVIEKASDSVLK